MVLTGYLSALSEGIMVWNTPSLGPGALWGAWVTLLRGSSRPLNASSWSCASTAELCDDR